MTFGLDTHDLRLRLRPADESDTGLILALIRELADFERLGHEVTACEEDLRRNLFGERLLAEVIIAEYDAKAAGFALFFHSYSTFLGKPGLYLEDLFVRPEHRGRRIGKALLVCLARIARERDCGRLEWSVLDWNEPAIGFYESLGARPMDEWTTYRVSGAALSTLAASE
jgi:GNAT superfamily N-acetyltransferase